MTVLSIDPGTTMSGYSLVGPAYEVIDAGKVDSGDIGQLIRSINPSVVCVESMQSYGASVGREIFETCFWIGEYRHVCRQCGIPFHLYPRPEYARAIAGVQKVTDSVLRQALLLRFGSDAKGGPLFKLKGDSDRRSAFALAVYHIDKSHHFRPLALR